jgi:hypothetical protein
LLWHWQKEKKNPHLPTKKKHTHNSTAPTWNTI